MPDQFTGEFANLGIVLFAPEANYLACKMTSRYARLSEFFGEVNGTFLMAALRRIESEINRYNKELNSPENTNAGKIGFENLEQLTASILPKDDSALQFSQSSYGIDVEAEITLHDLFERIIEKYNAEEHQAKHTDQFVWRKVYKNYFDKYGITKNLKKHKVPVNNVEINFDKAWKNGVWNCFQPLALDLKSKDAIETKVFKWSGIIRALEDTNEEMNLYFLINAPTEHKELESFIKETLSLKNNGLKVGIVEEDKAEAFAKKVRRVMEASNVIDDDLPF
jgi:hypothetical protein